MEAMTSPSQTEIMASKGYMLAAKAAKRIGYAPSSMYKLIGAGQVRELRIGRFRYVLISSLVSYLGEEAAAILGLTSGSGEPSGQE